MFEDELISLTPHYLIKKAEEKFIATRDESYCDLTTELGLDLIVICGRNGVGKSTLLQILRAKNFRGQREYTLFWKDNQDNILSTEKATLNLDGKEVQINTALLHIDSIGEMCGNGAEIVHGNTLRSGIMQAYAVNPRLYDNYNESLFDGFCVGYSPNRFSEEIELENSWARILGNDLGGAHFSGIIKEHPTLHVLADIAQDSTFEEALRVLSRKGRKSYKGIAKWLMDGESRKLDHEILKLIYKDGRQPSAIDSLKEDDNRIRYTISEWREVRDKIQKLSDAVDDWIELRLKGQGFHFWRGKLKELLWDHPFKNQPDGTRSELDDLSHGEYRRLGMRFLITPYLFQDHISWFFFDDACSLLHPEWNRCFVSDLLNTYTQAAKQVYKTKCKPKGWNRRLTCILVTHSPFILSDLMPQNIILLKNSGSGRTTAERGEKATFAGNIGEMFHSEFFMETTIGEFAREKIKKAIRILDGQPTSEEFQKLRKLFSNMGDEVLRNLLMEKLRNAENRTDQSTKR